MVNEVITLTADFPVHGGLVIGRHGGKVVMIKGAVPGETVEARIDAEKKDYLAATVVRVVDPSPDRVAPECRHFGACGGCRLQHIAYERQVGIKQEILTNTLKRMAGVEVALSEPISGKPWGYRHRGQFKVSKGKAGLFRERSHEIVEMDSCPLMTDEVNVYFMKARALIKDADATEAHISCGGGAFALISARGATRSYWDGLARAFMDEGFAGVVVEQEGKRRLKYGRERMTLDLPGIRYKVSPMSFFQANRGLNREVVSLVVEALQPLGGMRVLDLYSGAGNFSLPVALHAGRVTAVEENPYAVGDGNRNMEANGITNCTFVRGSADRLNIDGPFDVVIADPPRTGLAAGATDRILALRPGRVVYVSCDPATLARDLKRLSASYVVESVRMADFFPQTCHIEAVVFLKLKTS